MRAAIIGCGRIAGGCSSSARQVYAASHAGAYKKSSDVTLVAASDVNRKVLDQFCKYWNVPHSYIDPKEMMLELQPDVVSICTPDNVHADNLELCLEIPGVKAVLCEKPLDVDVKRATNLVRQYEEKGIVLAVNYQRRWSTEYKKAKEAILSGRFGRVQKVLAYYTKGICHNGSHAIDALMDMFGIPDKMQVLRKIYDFASDDPTVDARLMFGDVPVYLMGLDEREYTLFEIHIYGSSGRVNLCAGGRSEWFSRHDDPVHEGYRVLRLHEPDMMVNASNGDYLLEVLDDVVGAINYGRPVRSNGVTALDTLRICRQLASLEEAGFDR